MSTLPTGRARGAVDLLEESVSLLRADPRALAIYFAGAIPFLLALLYFLEDMTHNPFAAARAGLESFGVAAAWLWKNFAEALFMRRLHDQLSPGASYPLRPMRVLAIQSAIQPLALILLPFAWLIAFFRNVTLFAALGDPSPVRAARKQASLWPGQNWTALFIVFLGGLLLFANLLLLIVMLPQLGRSFLGIEGDLARLGMKILSLTTAGVAAGITWLAVDPLLDAFYTLRCFYGESLASGEDLLAALRRAVGPVAALGLFAIVLMGAAASLAFAQPPPAVSNAPATRDAAINPAPLSINPAPQAIDPAPLGRAMDQVIRRREFTWRMPTPAGPEQDPTNSSWLRAVNSMFDSLGELIQNFWKGLMKLLMGTPIPSAEPGKANAAATRRMTEIFLALAAVLAITAAALVIRFRRREHVVIAQAVSAVASVNLADESLSADQLPEESWRKLADEWLLKGDCRLAMRALYLAGLNYLGGRGLVSIRRSKSGLEYVRELERRARARSAGELGPVFTRSVALFERGWYGVRPVDRADVEDFAAGLDEIRSYAEKA